MAKTNLDSGFLILYDWLPAFRSLDGNELKKLLFALIEHQREGTPLPKFDDPLTAIFAQMIAPTIKRRLDGLVSATKASKPSAPKGYKSKSKTAESKEISDIDAPVKESVKSFYIPKMRQGEDSPESTVEGTVEGIPYPSKEEIRKEEISGAEIRKAERSEADTLSRIPDTDLSATEFARRLMESLAKDPPKKIYRE